MQKEKNKNRVFNGKIYIDPRIEVGDRVILDAEYANSSEVIVMQLGDIFARVRSGDMEWSTMRNRLTAIPKKEKDYLSVPRKGI